MEKEYSEKVYYCTLNRLFGFRPDITRGIIDCLGSAGELFKMKLDSFWGQRGVFAQIAPMLNEKELQASEEELLMLGDRGIDFITIADKAYPELLRDCPDAPAGLYFKSCSPAEEVFNRRRQIAVVGTRDISQYGQEWCQRIVMTMAESEGKPLIVSGFALGVDITAHLTALDTGLPTVAVLPTGITDVYPPQNRKYVDRLTNTPGCAFITDYPCGTVPKAINFLRRNRIIAGICSGTILIESKAKGGGMMTARLATSYNRDLMVLPGRADDIRSEGCNQLLKEKLAEPIVDGKGLLETLGLRPGIKRTRPGLMDEIETLFRCELTDIGLSEIKAVAKMIQKYRGISADELSAATGLNYSKIRTYTGLLECAGIISIDLLQRCSLMVRTV